MVKQTIENCNDLNLLQNLHFILYGTKSRENLTVLKRNILKGLPLVIISERYAKKADQIERELTSTEIQNLLSLFGKNKDENMPLEALFEILTNQEDLIAIDDDGNRLGASNTDNGQVPNTDVNIPIHSFHTSLQFEQQKSRYIPNIRAAANLSSNTNQDIYENQKNIIELRFELEETQLVDPDNSQKIKLLEIRIRKQEQLLELKQSSTQINCTGNISAPILDINPEINFADDIKKMLSRQSIGNSLRNFDGSSKFEWPAFLSEYNMTTMVCQYSNEENILRLNNSLKGQARQHVEMLLITSRYPQDIIDILTSVYGRQEDIILEILKKARQIQSFSDCQSFKTFEISIRNIVSAASNIEPQCRRESELQQILVSKLPENLIFQWGSYLLNRNSTSNDNNNLGVFKDWVISLADIFSKIGPLQKTEEKYPKTTFSSLCVVCEGAFHILSKCQKFISSNTNQRWNFAKQAKVCFCCLKTHSQPCSQRKQCGVNNCTRFHHVMLHKISQDSSTQNQVSRSINSNSPGKSIVLLKLLPIKIFGPKGVKIVTAFLDEGSNVSLIDANLAEDLGIEGPVKPLCINWTGDISRYDSTSKNLSLSISGTQNNSKTYNLRQVRTVDDLSLPGQFLNSKELIKKFPYISNVDLENIDWKYPKLLIGQDNADLIVTLQCVQPNSNSFILSKTKLGWTVHGSSQLEEPISDSVTSEISAILQCTVCDTELHELVKGHFGFEALSSINPNSQTSQSEQICVDEVKRSIKYTGNNFEVKLPWKDSNEPFPNTYPLAFSRLKCLQRKIRKEKIEDAYSNEIHKLLDKNYAVVVQDEELKDKKVWYLPHFPVINPKKPNKIRVVFDAAAKVSGKSLNDYLLSGPDLISSILGILLHFRLYKYALVGDVKEMFNQVQIDYDDSFAQCFLWQDPNSTDKPLVYRMQAMLFGLTSSPFLSQFVKNFNAERFEVDFPEAVKAIKDHTYVDDFIFGSNSEEEAIKLFNDVINIQAEGGFELRNCLTNSQNVLKSIPQNLASEKCSYEIESNTANQSVLGLKWNAHSDKLTFNSYFLISSDKIFNEDVIPTKRQALRGIMSIYDPIGILSPITTKGKMILQDVWRSGVNWDDLIPQNCYDQWKIFQKFVKDIQLIEINRWYSNLLINPDKIEIHTFCDASEKAYATAVYLRITKGCYSDSVLVAEKARVAPLKTLTIPKLELMAAVLGVRLYYTVKLHLGLKFTKSYFWTDSTAVLGWVKAEKKLPTFVSNRILEINQYSEINDWYWIPTSENIADLCTRGQIKTPLSKNTSWFKGPKFLQGEIFILPDQPICYSSNQVLTITEIPIWIPFEIKWNYSYIKTLRITCWINRFIKSCNGSKFEDNIITAEEMDLSLITWIKVVQNNSFLTDISNLKKLRLNKNGRLFNHSVYIDEIGLLKIRTRVLNDEFVEYQDPICLDGKHAFVQKLILHYHKNFNHQCIEAVINELRKKYWIPRIRSVVKSIIRNCFVCKRLKCKAVSPQMSCLPSERLLVSYKPFTAVGVDYFGSFRVKIGRRVEKRYGCLFICLTTRAIHVEIVSSLTTDSCLLAIRRLVARRGEVKVIWSDNGKYFVSASKELQQAREDISYDSLKNSLANIGINWKFIPPYSPHMGGSWERLIGCFKRAIETVLRDTSVKEEMLQTIFAEAECMVNSRPLTYSGSECERPCISPNDILMVKNVASFKENQYASNFRRAWRTTQHFIDEFWKRWLKEYLPTVCLRSKWSQETPPLKIGDIVVMNSQKLPRYHWPIGKVIEINNGTDGISRTAVVKTQNGIFKRAIHQLHRYISHDEISSSGENVAKTELNINTL